MPICKYTIATLHGHCFTVSTARNTEDNAVTGNTVDTGNTEDTAVTGNIEDTGNTEDTPVTGNTGHCCHYGHWKH